MPAVQTCNTYAFKKLENKNKLKRRISHLLLTDRPGDMLQHMTTCCPLEAQSPIGCVTTPLALLLCLLVCVITTFTCQGDEYIHMYIGGCRSAE